MARKPRDPARFLSNLYMSLFLIWLFIPLVGMTVTAFDASTLPSATPWKGVSPQWFSTLAGDARLMRGLAQSLLVALAVVALSLPLGLAGAMVLHRLAARASGVLLALLVSPILIPGLVVGLSTRLFWHGFAGPGGLWPTVLAQTSTVAAYVLVMFTLRLARFDPALEEAAFDLGASRALVMRRILLPFLAPTAAAAVPIAFLLSFADYTTTVFAIGGDTTLMTEAGARLRAGPSPVIDAVGVVVLALGVIAAGVWVLVRRPEPAPPRRR